MPDTPTASESGVPGYEANNWVGMVVPAGTPRARINRLNREIGALLRTAELREFLLKLAIEASPGTPEEFAAYISSESAKWSRVVKASGVKAE
jgi:tripartite-type tricarboxylate transporter receptor subunit TctC